MVLPDMDGKTHSLAEMRGKVVVVNFWATWCPPCREEMPSMQRVWELTREEGVVMLAVDVGETEETVFPFVAEHGIGFPILLDKDSAVTGRWPVLGLPTTFVIDPEGRMTYQAIGGRAWDSPPILEAIRGLRQPAEPKP
jgi:peroxiredoxin